MNLRSILNEWFHLLAMLSLWPHSTIIANRCASNTSGAYFSFSHPSIICNLFLWLPPECTFNMVENHFAIWNRKVNQTKLKMTITQYQFYFHHFFLFLFTFDKDSCIYGNFVFQKISNTNVQYLFANLRFFLQKKPKSRIILCISIGKIEQASHMWKYRLVDRASRHAFVWHTRFKPWTRTPKKTVKTRTNRIVQNSKAVDVQGKKWMRFTNKPKSGHFVLLDLQSNI